MKRFVLTALLCGLFMLGDSVPSYAETVRIETAKGDSFLYKVEVAKTAEQQKQGLMFRRQLPKNKGMLFPFDPPKVASFWMKNTFLSLDILFIRADGTIAKIIRKTKPRDETKLSSDEPVASVLEINGGETAHRGIKEGDKVILAAKKGAEAK